MNNPDKIRYSNILAEARDAAHYGDDRRASTLLCEAMLILNQSIMQTKAPERPGA